MLRKGSGALAALLIVAAAACGDSAERRVLTITGDSVVAITPVEFNGEVVSANCASSWVANVSGREGDYVTVTGGSISYAWEGSGQPITQYDWDTPEKLTQLWRELRIPAGEPKQSQQHGFGQSVPGQNVRATVVFRYLRGDEEEEHETEPYTFACRTP